MSINRGLANTVRERAKDCCEYCRLPSAVYPLPFQIDHIIARKHGGPSTLDNLALACCHCNLRKGANIAGRDLESNQLVRLFHPRLDQWRDHFAWAGATIVGKTSVGTTTARILGVNEPDFLAVREALIEEKLFSSYF